MGIDIIILGIIYKYPHYGYLVIFISLILAGLNLPISEDLMILTGGVLASAVIPEHTIHLWTALFIGAYLSDWLAYWTGRLLGPKLLTIKWLSRIIRQDRLDRMHAFYEKWGFFAFLFGRFVPFGVRNCLFISAGMGKMSFPKFLFIDGFAALLSTSAGFYLAYTFGRHYTILWEFIKAYDAYFWTLLGIIIGSVIGLIWYKKAKKVPTP